MVTDPKDVAELQKALNDTAGKASVLWTTFITFQLYLAIAFGSVTHRDLFLEAPIKLPLLNVDLPLVGFFVLAPILLPLLVFLQLLGLAAKAEPRFLAGGDGGRRSPEPPAQSAARRPLRQPRVYFRKK
jgi:hypothetical protein